jgi:Ni/Fe-hydrogenase 1 B-type cytochrome subunit
MASWFLWNFFMSNPEKTRRVSIWSGKLRLAHGGLAISVAGLLVTGLLIQYAPSIANQASSIHDFLSAFLIASLALRIWLLFTDKTTANWRALLPRSSQLKAMGEMIKFYLTFGKYKLPRWHAHNPFWIPVYAAVFLVLIIMIISGFMMEKQPLLFSTIYLPDVHRGAALLLLGFTIAHVITSILHDVKGSGSDISAILNGYRIFILEDNEAQSTEPQPQKIQFYSPKKPD